MVCVCEFMCRLCWVWVDCVIALLCVVCSGVAMRGYGDLVCCLLVCCLVGYMFCLVFGVGWVLFGARLFVSIVMLVCTLVCGVLYGLVVYV